MAARADTAVGSEAGLVVAAEENAARAARAAAAAVTAVARIAARNLRSLSRTGRLERIRSIRSRRLRRRDGAAAAETPPRPGMRWSTAGARAEMEAAAGWAVASEKQVAIEVPAAAMVAALAAEAVLAEEAAEDRAYPAWAPSTTQKRSLQYLLPRHSSPRTCTPALLRRAQQSSTQAMRSLCSAGRRWLEQLHPRSGRLAAWGVGIGVVAPAQWARWARARAV